MVTLGASLLELNSVLAQTAFLTDYNFEVSLVCVARVLQIGKRIAYGYR